MNEYLLLFSYRNQHVSDENNMPKGLSDFVETTSQQQTIIRYNKWSILNLYQQTLKFLNNATELSKINETISE